MSLVEKKKRKEDESASVCRFRKVGLFFFMCVFQSPHSKKRKTPLDHTHAKQR